MAKRLVLFNHKGGVSKTTSAYNIGWQLSHEHNVLLVDADPQCNLTSLILGDRFDSYYLDDLTKNQNIKDGVSPAFLGKPIPIESVSCQSAERAERLHLLAGHANLSEFDAALTFAQTSNNALATLQNLPGAFHELIRLTEERYNIDYTIIDINPSLSSVNQNLFLNSDGFVVPTNPDPFSVMAIKTLSTILPRWKQWKSNSIDLFADSAYPLRDGVPTFCGTLIQRFNIRNGRAARPYRDNISEINQTVADVLAGHLRKGGMMLSAASYPQSLVLHHYCLAEIPDFQGLLPKAFAAGVPVFDLEDNEIGEVGNVLDTMKEKRDMFKTVVQSATQTIKQLLANV
jgi:cellulose biosynthesis protein BcsQ